MYADCLVERLRELHGLVVFLPEPQPGAPDREDGDGQGYDDRRIEPDLLGSLERAVAFEHEEAHGEKGLCHMLATHSCLPA